MFFSNLASGCLKIFVVYASEEAIVRTQDTAQGMLQMIKDEIKYRCEDGANGGNIYDDHKKLEVNA